MLRFIPTITIVLTVGSRRELQAQALFSFISSMITLLLLLFFVYLTIERIRRKKGVSVKKILRNAPNRSQVNMGEKQRPSTVKESITHARDLYARMKLEPHFFEKEGSLASFDDLMVQLYQLARSGNLYFQDFTPITTGEKQSSDDSIYSGTAIFHHKPYIDEAALLIEGDAQGRFSWYLFPDCLIRQSREEKSSDTIYPFEESELSFQRVVAKKRKGLYRPILRTKFDETPPELLPAGHHDFISVSLKGIPLTLLFKYTPSVHILFSFFIDHFASLSYPMGNLRENAPIYIPPQERLGAIYPFISRSMFSPRIIAKHLGISLQEAESLLTLAYSSHWVSYTYYKELEFNQATPVMLLVRQLHQANQRDEEYKPLIQKLSAKLSEEFFHANMLYVRRIFHIAFRSLKTSIPAEERYRIILSDLRRIQKRLFPEAERYSLADVPLLIALFLIILPTQQLTKERLIEVLQHRPGAIHDAVALLENFSPVDRRTTLESPALCDNHKGRDARLLAHTLLSVAKLMLSDAGVPSKNQDSQIIKMEFELSSPFDRPTWLSDNPLLETPDLDINQLVMDCQLSNHRKVDIQTIAENYHHIYEIWHPFLDRKQKTNDRYLFPILHIQTDGMGLVPLIVDEISRVTRIYLPQWIYGDTVWFDFEAERENAQAEFEKALSQSRNGTLVLYNLTNESFRKKHRWYRAFIDQIYSTSPARNVCIIYSSDKIRGIPITTESLHKREILHMQIPAPTRENLQYAFRFLASMQELNLTPGLQIPLDFELINMLNTLSADEPALIKGMEQLLEQLVQSHTARLEESPEQLEGAYYALDFFDITFSRL